jgi:hypothetical protein
MGSRPEQPAGARERRSFIRRVLAGRFVAELLATYLEACAPSPVVSCPEAAVGGAEETVGGRFRPPGLELTTDGLGNRSRTGATHCSAVVFGEGLVPLARPLDLPTDASADRRPELDAIVLAWPSLPEHVRLTVLMLVKAAGSAK